MSSIQCILVLLTMYCAYPSILCMDFIHNCESTNIPEYDALVVKCMGADITSIPEGLPQNITELTIHHGNMTTLNISTLSGLQVLCTLKIEHSGLANIIDSDSAGLPTLRSLSLKGNEIVSMTNDVFSKLGNLETIDLSDNYITTLDEQFTGLQKLQKLSLHGNNISVISQEAFRDLTSLHHLELHSNAITHLQPQTFSSNKNLMFLSLALNPLADVSKVFPRDMILQYLNMSHCELQFFPKDLPPSLKYLQLSSNKIERISKYDVAAYADLNALVLENNGLSYIQPGALTALKSLKAIFLFVNNLKEIPGPFPPSITSVHLDNNNITDFDQSMFPNGTRLTFFSLRRNKITTLPSFTNFESISEFHVEGNPLQLLQDNVFSSLKGLHYLNLNRIQFQMIFRHCFEGLKELKKLEMSFVPRVQVLGNIFKPLVQLEELKLQESPSLAETFLNYLSVDNMKIATLKELNLMDNGLTSINSDLLRNLPNIQRLALSGNKLLCDSGLLWLKNWYTLEPEKFFMFNQVRCHQPHHLHGQSISDVPVWEFMSNTSGSTESSTSSSSIPTDITEPFHVGKVTHYYYFDQTTEEQLTYYDSLDDDDDIFDGTYDDQYDNFDYQTTSTITITSYNTDTSTFSTISANANTDSMDNNAILPASKQPNPKKKSELKAVGIAIAMSFGVILVMLATAFMIYKLWKRKQDISHQNNRHNCEGQDYVFVATHNDKPEPKAPRKLSRTERGSTTSRASEDITNHTDLDMKVYMLDVDA